MAEELTLVEQPGQNVGSHPALSPPLEKGSPRPIPTNDHVTMFETRSTGLKKWLEGNRGPALCLGWSLIGSSLKPKAGTGIPDQPPREPTTSQGLFFFSAEVNCFILEDDVQIRKKKKKKGNFRN